MPEQSYRFIQNLKCDYFPCHKTSKPEEFNCLFCYCPLYFLEECGGNWKSLSGLKDCTGCMVPHAEGGYDRINSAIMRENNKRKQLQNP